MAQIIYLGLCLLGCLILNPSVEGTATNSTLKARSRCSSGGITYRQHCYLFVDKAVTWHDAEIACQDMRLGSQLASILTEGEGKMVSRYMRRFGARSVWIGLEGTPDLTEMVWVWSDGSRFSPTLWDKRSVSQPTTSPECVALSSSDSYLWKQHSCSVCFPFLCKYKAA